jgi:hypothetical protein
MLECLLSMPKGQVQFYFHRRKGHTLALGLNPSSATHLPCVLCHSGQVT